ncbi:hypothetical protein L596_003461 [Steinernema carpocapsae]|uniref:Uncharacterized protein n=1 Tax=Steinernema carpocapsae TaxID=34508 RepID=A0A4U8USK4_STECR|nr:hypothetical protein L596_003461 [Steinernema carpocapsae]
MQLIFPLLRCHESTLSQPEFSSRYSLEGLRITLPTFCRIFHQNKAGGNFGSRPCLAKTAKFQYANWNIKVSSTDPARVSRNLFRYLSQHQRYYKREKCKVLTP